MPDDYDVANDPETPPPAPVSPSPAHHANTANAKIGGVWGSNVLDEARETILTIMRRGGRNAVARLKAASVILGQSWLPYLTKDELLAEVRRRIELEKAAGKPTDEP